MPCTRLKELEMTETTTPANVADVEEALRDVVDPELGINVVDLGLVYGITVDGQNHAVIDMTLTSRAWSPPTGSTGSGCRRGVRTRSPTTAASSCAPSASTSDPQTLVTRRVVEVAPARLDGWLERFTANNPDGPQRVAG